MVISTDCATWIGKGKKCTAHFLRLNQTAKHSESQMVWVISCVPSYAKKIISKALFSLEESLNGSDAELTLSLHHQLSYEGTDRWH